MLEKSIIIDALNWHCSIFELYFLFSKNRTDIERDYRYLYDWEVKIYITLPDVNDLMSIDCSKILFEKMKRYEKFDRLKMSKRYEDRNAVYYIGTNDDPIFLRKTLVSLGAVIRKQLKPDNDYQEYQDEYSFEFKDVLRLDYILNQIINDINETSETILDNNSF